MKKMLSVNFEAEIVDVKPSNVNRSFHEATTRIMAVGENANGTYFTKESIISAMPSLKNIPIVGLYKESEENFGGHEAKYEVKDGKMDVHFNTTPFGVIHESGSSWFEIVNENGIDKEYLSADCLFWKRQNGYELLRERGKFSVSMEIEVLDGHHDKETQLYCVDRFIFTAIAILGTDKEACFQSAEVRLFEKDLGYKQMMFELKQFTKESIENQEEVKNMEDQVIETVELSEVSESTEVLEVVESTDTNVVTEFEKNEDVATEEVAVVEPTEEPTEETEVVESTEESTVVEVEQSVSEYSEPTVSETYEKIEVEEPVDKDENFKMLLEQAVSSTTTEEIVEVFDKMLAVAGLAEFDIRSLFEKKESEVKAELEKVVSEYEAIKVEYERLVKFEKDVLDSRKQAELDQIFKNFESLNGVESYEKLKVEAMNMEIGDVRKELYSIWGAINFEKQLAESKKQEEKMDSSTIVYEKSTKQASHPSGVLGKYLPIK